MYSRFQCRTWLAFEMSCIPVVMFAVQLILTVRVLALYKHDKSSRAVTVFLAVLWVIAVSTVTGGIFVRALENFLTSMC